MTNVGHANIVNRLRRRFNDVAPTSNVKTFFHGELDRIQATWPSSPPCCLIEGCQEGDEPVDSHVVPDSFLRRLNPTKAPPYTPHLQRDGTITVTRVGRATRPVFPGYCPKHDREVFSWEASEIFEGAGAAESQLMRAADAMWHEYDLRMMVLAVASQLADTSNPGLTPLLSGVSRGDVERIARFSENLELSSQELKVMVDDLDELRKALRTSLDPARQGLPAFIEQVHLSSNHGPSPQLVDAAWVPRTPTDIGIGRDDRVPFVVSVLVDALGTHLAFASTTEGAEIVRHLKSELDGNSKMTIDYTMHWIRHGCLYWFMGDDLWLSQSAADQTQMKKKLETGPFTRAAFYTGADAGRLPIIRCGNGWG